MKNQDPDPGSYFRELGNNFWVKILKFFDADPVPGFFLTLDPGWKKFRIRDPGWFRNTRGDAENDPRTDAALNWHSDALTKWLNLKTTRLFGIYTRLTLIACTVPAGALIR